MRKIDVFGRKQNQARPLYLIVLVFFFVFAGYYISNYLQGKELALLEAEQARIQSEINQVVNTPEEETYYQIGEIIFQLPNTFDEYNIVNDLNYIRSASGLLESEFYQAKITDQVESPYSFILSDTIKFVKIEVSFDTDYPERVLDYLDYITSLDRFYYVSDVRISFFDDSPDFVEITIYSFYNDVELDS
ncbi:MAG: hypothetical protein V3569_04855 [Acholeplasmataceae bacterium]